MTLSGSHLREIFQPVQATTLCHEFENHTFIITSTFPRDQWVNCKLRSDETLRLKYHWRVEFSKLVPYLPKNCWYFIIHYLLTHTGDEHWSTNGVTSVLIVVRVVVRHCLVTWSRTGVFFFCYYTYRYINTLGPTKWPTFPRRHFQMHFLEWKCVNFD